MRSPYSPFFLSTKCSVWYVTTKIIMWRTMILQGLQMTFWSLNKHMTQSAEVCEFSLASKQVICCLLNVSPYSGSLIGSVCNGGKGCLTLLWFLFIFFPFFGRNTTRHARRTLWELLYIKWILFKFWIFSKPENFLFDISTWLGSPHNHLLSLVPCC